MTEQRGRAHRAVVRLGALVLVLTVVFLLGGGWYFSGQIRSEALLVRTTEATRDLRVVDASPTSVTLRATGDAPAELDDGTTYGLDWGDGYGQVSTVLDDDGEQVTRRFSLLLGQAPAEGQPARLSRDAFPDEADEAVGPTAQEVTYAGDRAAWFVPGSGTTWAVLAHGRGATRTELFRLMRTTAALGMPLLDITYRRDRENGGGLARFGQDEWSDLEAGVRYALDHGAESVVLLGTSMGGGITAAFLERSELAQHVDALVLDSPMLDLDATIAHGASQRELPVIGLPIPGALTWTATRIAYARFDLDADSVDYLDSADWLTMPALVFHGTEDGTVPDSVTRRLADEKPDLVEHVVVDGADHVESWNHDPRAYEEKVREFLTRFAL